LAPKGGRLPLVGTWTRWHDGLVRSRPFGVAETVAVTQGQHHPKRTSSQRLGLDCPPSFFSTKAPPYPSYGSRQLRANDTDWSSVEGQWTAWEAIRELVTSHDISIAAKALAKSPSRATHLRLRVRPPRPDDTNLRAHEGTWCLTPTALVVDKITVVLL